jgi:hypothetical protein
MAVDIRIDVNAGMGDNAARSPSLSGTVMGFTIDLPKTSEMVGLADDDGDDVVSAGT